MATGTTTGSPTPGVTSHEDDWQTEKEPPVEMTAHAEHVLYEICEALGHALLNYYEKENNE